MRRPNSTHTTCITVNRHHLYFYDIDNVNLCNPGDNKPHFIPGMMGPFLGVTLVPQTEVRNIMIPIFHDMMDWEQRKNGNFKQVIMTLLCYDLQIVCCGSCCDKNGQLFVTTYPHLLAEYVSACVCRWKQSWWISWTAWCRMGKAMIITESSSAFCKNQTCV